MILSFYMDKVTYKCYKDEHAFYRAMGFEERNDDERSETEIVAYAAWRFPL